MKIDFTRVKNDVNGNPRYVCHFLNFIKESDDVSPFALYDLALSRAKKIGGSKYRGKEYGGGIVFQSYNIAETEREIKELLKSL